MFTDPVYAVDHVFVRTAPGGEAAELLRSAGLVEGTRNHHPGQGTACRRFFFSNAMLKLLWLENEVEARSEQTRVTKLWERFSAGQTASPFGVILRPAPGTEPVWAGSPPMGVGRLRLELTKSVPFFPGTNTGLPKGHVDWLAGGSERITRDSYKGLP